MAKVGRPLKRYSDPIVQSRVEWLVKTGINRRAIRSNQLDKPMSNLAFFVMRNRVIKP